MGYVNPRNKVSESILDITKTPFTFLAFQEEDPPSSRVLISFPATAIARNVHLLNLIPIESLVICFHGASLREPTVNKNVWACATLPQYKLVDIKHSLLRCYSFESHFFRRFFFVCSYAVHRNKSGNFTKPRIPLIYWGWLFFYSPRGPFGANKNEASGKESHTRSEKERKKLLLYFDFR